MSRLLLLALRSSAAASSSFLPFLMTSGSAAGSGRRDRFGGRRDFFGAQRDDVRDHASRPGSPASSNRSAAMSLARLLWPIISSVTSTAKLSGISSGRHSISTEREMISSRPPCCLTPFGSPSVMHRNGDADALGQIDALQIGVQQVAPDRVHCSSTTMTGVVSPPSIARLKMVLYPVLLRRIWISSRGLTATRNRILKGAVNHGGNESARARAAGFILAARRAHFGGDGNIFSHFSSPGRVSKSDSPPIAG